MIGLRQRNRFPSSQPPEHQQPTIANEQASRTEEECESDIVTIAPPLNESWNTTRILLGRIEMMFQVVAICLYLFGFWARRKFHTAGDCEMTWSWPHFLHIHMPTTASPYRLLKFVDGRDQRFQKFLTTATTAAEATTDHSLQGFDWCGRTNETHLVLYIPGHWGSYKQARSLGAHGVQLTRAEEDARSRRAEHALANHLWSGVSSDPNTFVYDVYSIDFLNQGGAMHGNFLLAQSEFISEVILFLHVSLL